MKLLTIYTDGGSRGNPGLAGYGCYFVFEDGSTGTEWGWFDHLTNNAAEYQALLAALRFAVVQNAEHTLIKSDSQLMVRQMQGRYKCSSPDLQPLWLEATKLARQLRKVTFEHIPREQNKQADRLANKAMDQRAARTL